MSTFAEQLWNVPPPLTESLLHGVVCGLLCGAPGLSAQAYRRALIELLDGVTEMHEDEVDRFVELAADDLDAPDLSFAPLLPDLDVELDERLTCLGDWSGGFVLGFEEVSGELDGDALEAFHHIVQIADVGADPDEVGEGADAEADYFNVCEHLKVAVLMVRDASNDDPEGDLDEDDEDEEELDES